MLRISLLAVAGVLSKANAFNTLQPSVFTVVRNTGLASSSQGDDFSPSTPTPRISMEDEQALQWDLFTKHHAKGEWKGTWTSYNYMGDVIDETIASVNLQADAERETVKHSHNIVVGSAKSDCETCFDSDDVRTIDIATYSQGNLSKYRCASKAMCCGPSLLRSGAMSTELILSHGNGRVRVIFQHAPVWEQGVEPNTCPPQGLKLFRTMVSREALNEAGGPPTFQSEQQKPPSRGNPNFFRPVPPFLWHKKWAGSSWTWGEEAGDRGWSIDEMEEGDAWHGRPTGDTSDVWAMRLPGGILLQCPRVITTGRVGLCRLAWLPEDDGKEGTEEDGDAAKLLRVEASVMALEPIIDEENDVMLGFYPPTLGSLRCDVLQKVGELENTSMLEKLKNMGEIDSEIDGIIAPQDENQVATRDEDNGSEEDDTPLDDSGLDAIRNALKL